MRILCESISLQRPPPQQNVISTKHLGRICSERLALLEAELQLLLLQTGEDQLFGLRHLLQGRCSSSWSARSSSEETSWSNCTCSLPSLLPRTLAVAPNLMRILCESYAGIAMFKIGPPIFAYVPGGPSPTEAGNLMWILCGSYANLMRELPCSRSCPPYLHTCPEAHRPARQAILCGSYADHMHF